MSKRDVLVVGSGGREHALAHYLALNDEIGRVYVLPGNGGTALLAKAQNVDLDPLDNAAVVGFVKEQNIPWVVIGPEAPLVNGLADPLRKAGVLVFGPSKEAARLEGSKVFAAEFIDRHGIAAPASFVARTLEGALQHIERSEPGACVLKADGLASGKGVVLPETAEEAARVLQAMFDGTDYEGAGKSGVVIQERLHGPEVSAFAISDGRHFVRLPLTQDHKRLKNGDQGPNTGGMGAITPLPSSIVNEAQNAAIDTIIQQTIDGAAKDGMPFVGVLFVGLMMAEERGGQPVVIEFNVRFGDPEVEVLFMLLHDAGVNVADMLLQASKGNLDKIVIPETFAKTALAVAMAAAGYPVSTRKGDEVLGLEPRPGIEIFHAGTTLDGDRVVVNGGRVLYVTTVGDAPDEAAKRVYAAIGAPDGVRFGGEQHRSDIGHQLRTM